MNMSHYSENRDEDIGVVKKAWGREYEMRREVSLRSSLD